MHLLVLFFVGSLVGVLNTLAGGGSLISIPLLIFFGVPPVVANATNRVGIVMQNVFSVFGFHQKGVNLIRFSIPLMITGLIGSVIGASFAITVPDHLFKSILACVMLLVVGIMLFDPTKRLHGTALRLSGKYWAFSACAYFFIGLYAGFIQAGMGFLCLTANILINGMDLVKANAVKVTVALCYASVSLAVFVSHDLVWWSYGISLGAGTAVGGWFASRYSVTKGHNWLKKIVLVVVVAMAIRLLFFG